MNPPLEQLDLEADKSDSNLMQRIVTVLGELKGVCEADAARVHNILFTSIEVNGLTD